MLNSKLVGRNTNSMQSINIPSVAGFLYVSSTISNDVIASKTLHKSIIWSQKKWQKTCITLQSVLCLLITSLRWFGAETFSPLLWRHNGPDGVSSHQPHSCLLNRLFRRRSRKKHQSSASLAFVRGIHRSPVNSPHKGPVKRKIFPFDDVIMTVMINFGSRICTGPTF